jgi:hypothetical protein
MFDKVRILPMDKKIEFNGQSIEKVQKEFFKEDLPNREPSGAFTFYTGMSVNQNEKTLVLFQYDNHIVALANLSEICIYEDIEEDGYKGEYIFKDIQTVEPAVTISEFKKVWNEVDKFSNLKRKLDTSKFPDFLDLIKYRIDSIKPFIEKKTQVPE